MAKKDKTPIREPIFRFHGVDLSDESPIPEPKIGLTSDPITLGTPITFTTDETDTDFTYYFRGIDRTTTR